MTPQVLDDYGGTDARTERSHETAVDFRRAVGGAA